MLVPGVAVARVEQPELGQQPPAGKGAEPRPAARLGEPPPGRRPAFQVVAGFALVRSSARLSSTDCRQSASDSSRRISAAALGCGGGPTAAQVSTVSRCGSSPAARNSAGTSRSSSSSGVRGWRVAGLRDLGRRPRRARCAGPAGTRRRTGPASGPRCRARARRRAAGSSPTSSPGCPGCGRPGSRRDRRPRRPRVPAAPRRYGSRAK